MSNIIGYADPIKAKSRKLLQAFCTGAGGMVLTELPRQLLPGTAVFYGVSLQTAHLYQQAVRERREFIYIDNAYFDSAREVYFRVTRNALQWDGSGVSNGRRFAHLNIRIAPWRASGEHVLLCPQSDLFMFAVCGYQGSWLRDTKEQLRKHANRELRLRPWNGNKRKWFATLHQDLKCCHAVVVYSSSSAISAMLNGVPAICTAQDCVAAPLIRAGLDSIERPPMPERQAWVNVVADHQWTLDEMRSGQCWQELQMFHAEQDAA